MPDYAAIVLYFRAGDVLGATLDALRGQTSPPDEVLVVDNASGDGAAARIVEERPGVRLVALDRNEGYAGGMNRGIQELRSNAPHVLFLTHEAELAVDAAEEMLKAVTGSGAVAAGPLLHRLRDDSVWSAGGTLSARGATGHLQAPPATDSAPYRVDWLDGAVLLLNRAVFEAVGRFDERFFLYWEDVDICVRMQEHGPVMCVPRARAAQETGSTPPYYASRNRIMFWKARGSRSNAARAIIGEAESTIRDVARRRPRLRDAAGRALGIADGLTGRLNPSRAGVRTR